MRNKINAFTGAILQCELKDAGIFLNLIAFNNGYIIAQANGVDYNNDYFINPENVVIESKKKLSGIRIASINAPDEEEEITPPFFRVTDKAEPLIEAAKNAIRKNSIEYVSKLKDFFEATLVKFDYTDREKPKFEISMFYKDSKPESLELNDEIKFSIDRTIFESMLYNFHAVVFYNDNLNFLYRKRPLRTKMQGLLKTKLEIESYRQIINVPENVSEYYFINRLISQRTVSDNAKLRPDYETAFNDAAALIDKVIELELEYSKEEQPESGEIMLREQPNLLIQSLKSYFGMWENLTSKRLEPEPETRSELQPFPIKPDYKVIPSNDFERVFEDFKSAEYYSNVAIEGYSSATFDYTTTFYQGNKRGSKHRYQVTNSLTLHRPNLSPKRIDPEDLQYFVNTEIEESMLVPTDLTITKDDNEVLSGIETCINFIISQYPELENYTELLPISLSFDDIAVGMGYTKSNKRLDKQIGQALAKFNQVLVTNDWRNESYARAIDEFEAIDLYGETVSCTPVAARLLNFMYCFIENPKTQKTRTSKGLTKKYQGKLGISIIQFPPLTAYNRVCNHQILIPVEWINIPKTGNNKEMKRIKYHVCKRVKDLIYFRNLENNRSNRDKRNFDPNRSNYNKFVIDDLLEIGGYDLSLHEFIEEEEKDKNGNTVFDENGEPVKVIREATPEELKKQENSIRSKRTIHTNQIIKYFQELKKVVPEIKAIKIENRRTKDGKCSVRVIV